MVKFERSHLLVQATGAPVVQLHTKPNALMLENSVWGTFGIDGQGRSLYGHETV